MIYTLRAAVPYVIALTLVFGSYMFVCWLHEAMVLGSPVVSGTVLERKQFSSMGKEWGDFTIQVSGSDVTVHAITQPYLLAEIPEQVQFRYNGDPAREVFLFDHEEDPLLILLFCGGGALFFVYLLYREKKNGLVLGMFEREY